MRVLVGCEFSGRVRESFRKRGHDAVSCDYYYDSEIPGPHSRANVLDLLGDGWDMLICFPPCDFLTNAGARWNPERRQQQTEAVEFADTLLSAPISRICLENPPGVLSTRLRKPDQAVCISWFGHHERKVTHLWLKNLPPLVATNPTGSKISLIHAEGRSTLRKKARSRIRWGLADAMGEQWGGELPPIPPLRPRLEVRRGD